MDPVQVNNVTPLEAEAEAVVQRLRPLKAGGHTHLRADHLKQWLQETYLRVNSKNPPMDRDLDVSGENHPAYVAYGGDPTGVGVDRF